MQFCEQLNSKKIIVCIGAGGVGKTTVSIMLAFLAASLGKKTLVVTIDPAKRLADALGLQIGAMPSVVNTSHMPLSKAIKPKAPLYAMMLDSKTAWRDLIIRLSKNKKIRENIFTNRFYRYLAEEMAGSQEFVAGETLYTLASESDFDLIVLDTPPTVQVLDFLEAPDRVLSFFDKEAFRIFLPQKSSFLSRLGFQFLKGSNALALSVFRRFVSTSFLQELTEFLTVFSELYDPLVKRAAEFSKLLKNEKTTFLVITAPQNHSLRETIQLVNELKKKELQLGGLIVNQVTEAFQYSFLSKAEEDLFDASFLAQIKLVIKEEEKKIQLESELLDKFQKSLRKIRILSLPRLEADASLTDSLERLLPKFLI